MAEYKLFDFERKDILEYAKTFESIEERIKYLKFVRREYKINPPELDTNYGIRPGLVKVLCTEIEYLEEESKQRFAESKKGRIRDNVSNEVIAEEVTKLWDDGIENLERVFIVLSEKSKNLFGIQLTKYQIKGRYQRYCTTNKDFKREKYK